MTSPALAPADRTAWAVAAALAAAAIAFGAAVAFGPDKAFAGLIAAVFVGAVAYRPLIGACSLVAITPLVAFQVRGLFVPGLRTHEAVVFAVLLGIGLCLVGQVLRGERLRVSLHAVDLAFAIVAFTGSVLPALLAFGRGRPITGTGIGQLVVFPKYFLIYLVFRIAARTADDVKRVVLTAGASGLVVSAIALIQTVFIVRVNDLLLRAGAEQTEHFVIGKTTATIGNAILAGMYFSILLAVALSLFFRDLARRSTQDERNWRRTAIFAGASGLYFLAAMATGQLSTLIACFLALVIAMVANRFSRYLGLLPLVGGIGLVALWPVFKKRLDEFQGFDELPRSWADRLANVERFFLPELRADDNWLWSVRPETTAESELIVTGKVFLESGYLAMLWIGGIFLLGAVVWFQITALRTSWQRVRRADPWLAACATGAFVGFLATAVLMLIDSHLTFRGSADLLYTVLALSLVPIAAPIRSRESSAAQ